MVNSKGLIVDGSRVLSDFLQTDKTPFWLDFVPQISHLAGNYDILNLTSGLTNLETFLFRMPKYAIGGIYFDGIIQTSHSRKLKATQYPVQSGVNITDHAIIEPATLTVEIMMSDCYTDYFRTNNDFLDIVYESLKILRPYIKPGGSLARKGQGRSIAAWSVLKFMQLSREPIVVETRLDTYRNMLIEEVSSVDTVRTRDALKCTVKLKEIIFANVAETQISARSIADKQSNGGQTTAKSSNAKK